MTRNLSVFLDLLRLLAATLVVLGHGGRVFRLPLPDIVGHSAKEAVAMFFVLSGFVIGYVTSAKERDWRTYAKARALRLYSVVPLAILVLLACYFAGSAMFPVFYGVGDAHPDVRGGALFGELPNVLAVLRYGTFTNELWFDRSMIVTGAPFWSLAFEAAYYIAFGILFFGRGAWRWALALGWVLVFGPRILVAFPMWLLGLVTWHLVAKVPCLPRSAGLGVLAAIAIAAIGWRRYAGNLARPLFEWHGVDVLASTMGYYLVLCGLLAAAILVFDACTKHGGSIWPPGVERMIRFGAGASFTLYITHLPIMVLMAAALPGSAGSYPQAGLAMTLTILGTFLLAEMGERRKSAYRQMFINMEKVMYRKIAR